MDQTNDDKEEVNQDAEDDDEKEKRADQDADADSFFAEVVSETTKRRQNATTKSSHNPTDGKGKCRARSVDAIDKRAEQLQGAITQIIETRELRPTPLFGKLFQTWLSLEVIMAALKSSMYDSVTLRTDKCPSCGS
ncbi:hypothetical protein CF319_g7391 [Tilletia indica]|nr:hypothetical protein CF327_g7267 [Tilletia walkeri]KAE8218797.1 hypothetical protein CF319_g7391 [Tilletia indica]